MLRNSSSRLVSSLSHRFKDSVVYNFKPLSTTESATPQAAKPKRVRSFLNGRHSRHALQNLTAWILALSGAGIGLIAAKQMGYLEVLSGIPLIVQNTFPFLLS